MIGYLEYKKIINLNKLENRLEEFYLNDIDISIIEKCGFLNALFHLEDYGESAPKELDKFLRTLNKQFIDGVFIGEDEVKRDSFESAIKLSKLIVRLKSLLENGTFITLRFE